MSRFGSRLGLALRRRRVRGVAAICTGLAFGSVALAFASQTHESATRHSTERAMGRVAMPGRLVITHVTVIDVAGGAPSNDTSLVIEGNRITQMGSSQRLEPPKDALAVDGTGKFLIPGLWDMHVHTFFGTWVPGGKDVTLPLFVANGITGVRDMGSELDRGGETAGSAHGGGGADAGRPEDAVSGVHRDWHTGGWEARGGYVGRARRGFRQNSILCAARRIFRYCR